MDERQVFDNIRRTLQPQEAKVILLMRELPYQIITIRMEDGKVVHKEQRKSIKD